MIVKSLVHGRKLKNISASIYTSKIKHFDFVFIIKAEYWGTGKEN